MSLQQDLRAERVGHMDLSAYVTVETDVRVNDVLRSMREQGYNCALVTKGERLVGIFTDRDVLRKVADAPETWGAPVDRLMTPTPHTVHPDDQVGRALDLMNTGHYRNMPVVDDGGKIVGNLTQFAIIKFLSDRFSQAVYNLPPEPDQVAKARDGA
ncbi:MAG: CBS domain-containing protein [Candidatus Latescibacteria bacterium]|nr:CBS domain-containing protein [Candidatus Latescibacterota bacterium]